MPAQRDLKFFLDYLSILDLFSQLLLKELKILNQFLVDKAIHMVFDIIDLIPKLFDQPIAIILAQLSLELFIVVVVLGIQFFHERFELFIKDIFYEEPVLLGIDFHSLIVHIGNEFVHALG